MSNRRRAKSHLTRMSTYRHVSFRRMAYFRTREVKHSIIISRCVTCLCCSVNIHVYRGSRTRTHSGRPTGTHLSAFAGPPLIWTTLGKSKFHSFPLYSIYFIFTYSTPSRPEVTLSVIFGKIRTLGKSKFHSLPMYIQRILYALSL